MQAPRLVLALALCLHTATALLCEESGYCSVGKVQSYVGDIHQGVRSTRAASSKRAGRRAHGYERTVARFLQVHNCSDV